MVAHTQREFRAEPCGRSLPADPAEARPATLWRFDLQRPRPLLAAALAAPLALLFCWPSWPGFMSFDSLFAYGESINGIVTAIWPPMSAYLYYLSRHAGAGVAGLFFGQTFLLFFSAFLILSLFARRAAVLIAAALLFALCFVWFSVLWGVMAVIWKDVTTTSFALLATGLWLLAVRRRSMFAFVLSAAAVGMAAALRYNAFPLTAFLVLLSIALPLGEPRRRRQQALAAALMAAALGLAFLSMRYRLPDLQRLPAGTGFAAVQEFDLIGISACEHENLLPAALSASPVTADDIAALYDPRHVQLAFMPRPGRPTLLESDAAGEVERAWPGVVAAHPGCYLRHRAAVFAEQMGLRPHVFYPTHSVIDPNPYGLALAHPDRAARLVGYVAQSSDHRRHRVAILYVLAPLLVLAAWLRRTPARLLLTAIVLGAFAYPATLFFVGPAADARYIFPANVMCLLTIFVAALDLARAWRPAGIRT